MAALSLGSEFVLLVVHRMRNQTEEVAALKDMFMMLDRDQSGFINESTLRAAIFDILGDEPSTEDVSTMIAAAGREGKVFYSDFVRILGVPGCVEEAEDVITEISGSRLSTHRTQ
mmetsp:Transcript_49764/g.116988  ORF Transcript_49764/g.116988 Transcript_49764/m.116988 type:complete len:115 (-) Transcript_49764:99-443(-)